MLDIFVFNFLMSIYFSVKALLKSCMWLPVHSVRYYVILKMNCWELQNLYLLKSSLLKSVVTYSITSHLNVNPFLPTTTASTTSITSISKTKPKAKISYTKNRSQELFRSFCSFVFLLFSSVFLCYLLFCFRLSFPYSFFFFLLFLFSVEEPLNFKKHIWET